MSQIEFLPSPETNLIPLDFSLQQDMTNSKAKKNTVMINFLPFHMT